MSKSWLHRKIEAGLASLMHGRRIMTVDFKADGIGVRSRNLGFLQDERFCSAWQHSLERNRLGWKDGVPDVRWRAHVCLWAAQTALSLEGDFVECGVHTGLYSNLIVKALAFETQPKRFWLFDTFSGIPVETLSAAEMQQAHVRNKTYSFDVENIVRESFRDYPNVMIVKGVLPETLSQLTSERISFLSVDLNNRSAEEATIRELWGRLVPGCPVVIDDYGFKGHEEQYGMWNAFAAEVGKTVLTLPTGQGLMIR